MYPLRPISNSYGYEVQKGGTGISPAGEKKKKNETHIDVTMTAGSFKIASGRGPRMVRIGLVIRSANRTLQAGLGVIPRSGRRPINAPGECRTQTLRERNTARKGRAVLSRLSVVGGRGLQGQRYREERSES